MKRLPRSPRRSQAASRPRRAKKASGRTKQHLASTQSDSTDYQWPPPGGPNDPVWLLLNESDPKFVDLKKQALASLWEVALMAEARPTALTEEFARLMRSGIHTIPGGASGTPSDPEAAP
jgi:hypothetical protein